MQAIEGIVVEFGGRPICIIYAVKHRRGNDFAVGEGAKIERLFGRGSKN